MKAKSFLLVAMAFIGCCNLSLANTWRVCSAPNSAAHFSNLTEALASTNVVDGDTLYLESGHMDRVGYITKSLCIIGPGYNMADNGFNMMNAEPAVFTSGVYILANKCHIEGCVFNAGVNFEADSITIEKCNIKYEIYISSKSFDNIIIHNFSLKNNLIEGVIRGFGTSFNYHFDVCGGIIENNIIIYNGAAFVCNEYKEDVHDLIIRNNTIISTGSSSIVISGARNSILYNNILISSSSNVFNNVSNCLIYNNVVSSDSASMASLSCSNMVYNATVENTFLANGTIENYYQHLPSGLAVGAGVNGTTCGAYGCTIEGGRPYAKSGIPNGMPVIFDAVIDQAPSPSNTISVSFKTKVNHE